MIGQGSPDRRRAPIWRRWPRRFLLVLAGSLAALCLELGAAEPLDVRLRIAWGGGEARSWQGTIRVSAGTLSEATPLGLEPDEPGSMQLVDEATIRIDSRSPRSYDGCDVRVQAPSDSKLLVQLTAPPFIASAPVELPLARLVRDFTQFNLDDRNNRLLAQRSPGDALRVTIGRSTLVFAPREKLELEVQPQHLDLSPGTTYLLAAALVPARTDETLWSSEQEVRVDAAGAAQGVALAAPLPDYEGVFDLRLALHPKRLISANLVRGKPLAARSVQVVSVAPVKTASNASASWETVFAFDPASPKWWEAMTRLPTWTRLPTIPRPVGSGGTTTMSHQGRAWVQMAGGGWQAYPLSITAPGAPHFVDIEYPTDIEQTLAISLVEPNAAGFVGPIGLDSGIEVPAVEAGHKAAARHHRIPFWPQTRTPYLLLLNRSDARPAVFGKIDVQAGPASLPPLIQSTSPSSGRMLAAYYDKPLFVENFSASEAVDPVSRRGLDDWVTFFTAGQRLIETLHYGGYNAVVMSAACEGSAIYPSTLLEPTPKYDSGVFFDSGQDAQRKDVLEMLFRLCDRSGIVLIPAVQFVGPLPELEELRQRGGEEGAGLEPVGPDGRTWRQRTGNQAAGVYYNVLDERVQRAMLHVIGELAERYGQHASFGGVAVQLSAENYSLLPDETCSLDATTFGRFLAAAKLDVPPTASSSPQARWAFIRQSAPAEWLDWRCNQVAGFYQRARDEITSRRATAKLILTTANLLAGRQLQTVLRPELPPHNSAVEIMPLLGLDTERLGSGIVVPRPQRIVTASAANSRDQEVHWNRHRPLDAFFLKAAPSSSLHFLPPAPMHLPDFDAASPFGPEKTRTLLISQVVPADAAYRERFVTSLARMDASLMIDGGWLLPLGQEAALAPLARVFRRLPAEPFQLVSGDAAADLVVRTLAKADKTYFYAINPMPWPVTAKIEFSGSQPLRMTPYHDERPASVETTAMGLTLTVELEAFDLVGGEIAGAARVVRTSASSPPEAGAALREQIGDVKKRAHFLHDRPHRITLVNAGFDEAAADGSALHWIHEREERGMVAEVDRSQGATAPGSLHLVNRSAAPLWVRSSPLRAPATGRLQMMAKVRVADGAKQPLLRLAIEGRVDGQVYYQRATFGRGEREQGPSAGKLSTAWTQCTIARANLPMQGLTDLRVGFDLMSEGEVWIDDVQVTDLWLEEAEYNELLKTVPTAKHLAENGRLNECRLLVDGYWPSFLRRHVELGGSLEEVLPTAVKAAPAAADAARPKTGFLPPAINLPKATPRAARAADRGRNWWNSWMPKWK